MNPLKKGSLFRSIKTHLASKGIVLENGEAADKLKAGCNLLTSVVNDGQAGFTQAKTAVTAKLDSIRQSIHESTAPAKNAPAKAAPVKGNKKASKK